MKIVSIFNKLTNNTFPGDFGGENFLKHCLNNPDEFTITYAQDDVDEPKIDKYSPEALKAYSMPDLREIYKVLLEKFIEDGGENAPPPTTSVDGIIKAIVKLQGD